MGDKIDRPAQSWRVRTLEGLKCGFLGGIQNTDTLFTRPAPEVERQICKIAAESGDPKILDDMDEVIRAASLFMTPAEDNVPKLYRGTGLSHLERPGRLRHVLTWTITDRDINQYFAESMESRLEKIRSDILAGLHFADVHHPLARLIEAIPIGEFHSWRGLPAFDALASHTGTLLDDTHKRDITFLYPAAGRHYPYLLTAMKLIDRERVDRVHVIATELDVDGADYTNDFVGLYKSGILDRMVTLPKKSFADGGTEQKFVLGYKGKQIDITLALKRSGEAYFRDDYLKQADVMIIHDCADGGEMADSYKLLSEMIVARRRVASDKKQLVLMEGYDPQSVSLETASGKPLLGFEPPVLPGPYGHCSGVNGLGEFQWCDHSTAHAIRLDDSRLSARIGTLTDVGEIRKRLFVSNPFQFKVYMAVPSGGRSEDQDDE